MSPRDLQALIAVGDIDLVDVREPDEWATGHIPGARLAPLAQVRTDPKGTIPRDRVVFVCAKGGRSATAAKLADDLGWAEVYSLDGGIGAWAAAGLETIVPELPRAGGPAPQPAPGAASSPGTDAVEPALDAVIGANLRDLRAAQGYSLDDLAREAGVSRTLLGQVEIGRAAASIGVVWKLAQTLGVPFSALLSSEPRLGTTVTRRADAKRLLSADGRFSSRALYPFGDPKSAEFYELYLAPHSREDAEAHRPGTSENLVVTAGRLELHIGRDVRQLEPGDSVIFSADVPHSYVNPGKDPCWMYLVMNYART
ncbi:MAG: rhodanese-like domain-containing protein [Deltaproteobacteria bacterium]